MPSYGVIGTKCPTLPYPSTLIDPADEVPTTLAAVAGGETIEFPGYFNQNAAAVDALGQVGAGAYAVVQGTGELTAGTGLSLDISEAVCTLDGVVVGAAAVLAMQPSAYNWVYMLQAGTFTKTNDATDTPPANPAVKCVFLGRVQTSASAITDIDYSGRLEWRGGLLYRRLGDGGAPTDSPVARYQIVTRAGGGVYLWTGDQYVALAGALGTAIATVSGDGSVSLSDFETLESNYRRFLLNAVKLLGAPELAAGIEEQLELAVAEAA